MLLRLASASAAAGTALLLAVAAPGAPAASVDDRTQRVSIGPSGADAQATSRHAAISGDGRFVAFDTDATELVEDDINKGVADVYLRDVFGLTTGIVSRGPGGPAGNGPSTDPAISHDGTTVAFVSSASNLVVADLNGVDDILVRTPPRITRASVSSLGIEADAPSSQPDVSGDGRYVAFASEATNLAPDDDNGQPDVFVRDMEAGTTTLVSRGKRGSAAGASTSPAISPGGRFVSFTSDAADLVAGDRNVAADVFLADLETGEITRVSVDSRGREQEDATKEPFVPVSDVSDGGRFVVFDSDADTLVARDTNGAEDVFLRDVPAGTTHRVSVDAAGREGDNDSFFPTITPDGRFIAYESFAGNLAPRDTRREDLFVHDRLTRLPSLVDVPASGRRKGAERLRQLLQRPSLTADGQVAAFSSTAPNLVKKPGGRQDVYVRALAAPEARIGMRSYRVEQRAPYRLVADDPNATDFHCTMDGRPFTCGPMGRLPRFTAEPHVLRVHAGGPGMLWQEKPVVRRFIIR